MRVWESVFGRVRGHQEVSVIFKHDTKGYMHRHTHTQAHWCVVKMSRWCGAVWWIKTNRCIVSVCEWLVFVCGNVLMCSRLFLDHDFPLGLAALHLLPVSPSCDLLHTEWSICNLDGYEIRINKSVRVWEKARLPWSAALKLTSSHCVCVCVCLENLCWLSWIFLTDLANLWSVESVGNSYCILDGYSGELIHASACVGVCTALALLCPSLLSFT